MLNSLRLEQKPPSEVDSSDSGSELGLEPETDRFGFLLTDGSTDGIRRAGPSPVLVRQREAKWINILDQWDRLLLKKTSKIKLQCHKGIPASLRARCWSLLSGATDRMNQQKDLYKLLDSQPALKHWEDVIERDLDRQFPFHEMFVAKDGHGQRSLFQILKAYTKFMPEEGYCQAQGPVAAVLLMNMPAEEAFWCLVQICEQYLPGYYSPLLEGVLFDAAILMWVLKRSCPAAHKHLQNHGVEPLMFATDWLMCLFTRHLPFNTLLRVWDLFFCYGIRVLLQVAVVLVQRVLGREDQRKQCCGQMETLQRLRGIREEVKDEEDDFVVEVLSVSLSVKDLQRRTEKELQRWQKERPSSTFDPRDRCLGYHMAWLRSRQNIEQCERREREKLNLSVPLFRSASTLSLTTSKWQKGVKANSKEPKSSVKVMRHLSMGAKADCQSWANLNVKKVQNLQDSDFVFKEKKKQSEPRQEHNIQLNKLEKSENDQIKNATQITDKAQTEEMKEMSKAATDLSEQEENIDTKLTQNDQQNEKQSIKNKDLTQNQVINTEGCNLNKDCAAETNQPSEQINKNMKTEVDIGQENMKVNLHQVKSLKQLATEAAEHTACDREHDEKNIGETQQQNKGTDKHLEKLSFLGKLHSTESLTGSKLKRPHIQAEVELKELAAQGLIHNATTNSNDPHNIDAMQLRKQIEKTEAESFVSCSNDIQARRQVSTVKLEVSGGMEDQTIVDFQSSPKTCDEMEEATYFKILPQMHVLSSESSGVNLSTEADTSTDNIKQGTYEREAQSNVYKSDKELIRKNFSEIQQLEGDTNTNQQFSFRLSGDFRVRKSSSSHGSRSARRLSEDLFTSPKLVEQKMIHNLGDTENNATIQMLSTTETEAATHKEQQPKRFGLFRRLREENKNKRQSKPKIQVPKILIQDYSDERDIRQVTEVECKLTSRERRRQLREQKRKEKEHEREKKKEKDLEKECKRDQARCTSVQTQSQGSPSRSETSYSDVYF